MFQTQILSEPIHLWYNTQIGWALDLIDLTVCKLWPELMVSAESFKGAALILGFPQRSIEAKC